MRSVNVDGMAIAFAERGDGPALVLLHGFLCDHRDWAPQLEGLSGAFRVIAWDAPGCGASPDPPEHWRFAEYADCLAGFLDAVSVERAIVGGLSWGGTLAQEFYGRHASRVEALVLADTYAGWGPSLGADGARERLDLCLRLSEMAPADVVARLMGGMLTAGAPHDVVEEQAAIMADFHPSGFRTMSYAVAEVDTRAIWPAIAVPTLLIWGEEDQRSPLAVAEQFRAGIPGAELVVIPGGHVSNIESPDAFNRAILDFHSRIVVPGRVEPPVR